MCKICYRPINHVDEGNKFEFHITTPTKTTCCPVEVPVMSFHISLSFNMVSLLIKRKIMSAFIPCSMSMVQNKKASQLNLPIEAWLPFQFKLIGLHVFLGAPPDKTHFLREEDFSLLSFFLIPTSSLHFLWNFFVVELAGNKFSTANLILKLHA